MGRRRVRQRLTEYRSWFDEFPLADLISLSIVTGPATVEDQIEQLLEFFGVADPSSYRSVYAKTAQSFRRAQHLSVNPQATAVWLRLAERQAENVSVSAYNKLESIGLLKELPRLTLDPISESFPVLKARCADVGVAVVYTESMAGTRASAAVRWLGPDRPIIALTSRGKHEDGGDSFMKQDTSYYTLGARVSLSSRAMMMKMAQKRRPTISPGRPCCGVARGNLPN